MRIPKVLAVATIAGWVALVLCWLWDIVGEGAPRALLQVVVFAALFLTVLSCLGFAMRLWQRSDGDSFWTADRLLLVLVIVALGVHWIGVDWEVTGRYYRDEGIYYAAANSINQGELFPESFIYGHLPYYVFALVLWIQSLFPTVMAWAAGALFGLGKEVDVSWILLRGINTTLGALTTIPVFIVGRRIAGTGAAVLGSILIIFSPVYNEITRLIISDVPSAFFAAVCLMFVALLLDEERLGPYLAAGVAAALAAASKYPAGVVAVAIVGIWLAWRVRTRRWSWHLLAAGSVSLGSFLAVMPAFLVHRGSVFVGEGKDLLFGFRQYGKGGWIGVVPESNALWYGEHLVASFGWGAVVLGILGWLWLERESRRRLLWMLPYPVVFWLLLISMSMVVKRNLLPAIPAYAAVIGVGLAGWVALLGHRLPDRFKKWSVGLMVGVLAVPVYRTSLQTVSFARPSTREEAAAWIDANVPRGAAIIKESYTPHLHKKKYTVHQTRFIPRVPLEEVRGGQWDYVLMAKNAYGRFLDPENWEKPHHEFFAQRYEEMLQFDRAQEFVPNRTRMGPTLELYKADPVVLEYLEQYRFGFEGEGFRFPRDDAYLLLKEYLAAGQYRIAVETEPPTVDGRVAIVTRDGRDAGEAAIVQSTGLAQLSFDAKYFLYIYLPKDTIINAFEMTGDP